ncbi:protein kinase domain-containing protein [Ktedonospora formicarum]|uniref:non-specific serine/threonine protein kinase n=1 Tax=Ktedonospora formicarum TaxID=2778364 RepID=A0A8J3I639_9CHLR|nr:protein kinase [Ktedonospora formicarum]GHO48091.1 hypothetical protein KSX_62540 [Ktedonospora formicarum]
MAIMLAKGRFRIYQMLVGSGVFGSVYRAYDTLKDREVAVKLLLRTPAKFQNLYSGEEEYEFIVKEEFKLLQELAPLGVFPKPIGIIRQNRLLGIVMEFIEGESLMELLNDGPLPVERVLDYGVQLAEQLEALHTAGVINRDTHPGNIMVVPDRTIRLVDAGLIRRARKRDLRREQWISAMRLKLKIWATMYGHVPPEVVRGQGLSASQEPLTPQADVYGLGGVLLDSLLGHKVFAPSELWRKGSEDSPSLPMALCELIEAMRDSRPEYRPLMAEVGWTLRTLRGQ